MARTVDIIMRDTVGNLVMQIAQLTAELEACREKCQELENAKKDA